MSYDLAPMTRADRRRARKATAKQKQYERTGFRAVVREEDNWERHARLRPSKYTPHIGAKQRAKGLRRLAKAAA